jgi:hypothetical protein
MTLIEAINTANSPYAVSFLLTAYLESLQQFRQPAALPQSVTDLPIAGPDDIRRRAALLNAGSCSVLDSVFALAELRAVFSCAVARIGKAFHAEDQDAFASRGRAHAVRLDRAA